MKLNKELGTLTDKSFYSSCDLIINETMRLSSTIEEFRKLINDTSPKALFSVKETIEKNHDILFSTLLTNGVDIELFIDIDYTVQIRGTASSLIQSLLYVLNNANDALLESDKEYKLVLFKIYNDDKNLMIDITDNATGIELNIMDKIFEPYFTTKHQSHGKGLGLYVVYKTITEMFNGKIEGDNITFEIKEKPYYGANFHFEIPIAAKL